MKKISRGGIGRAEWKTFLWRAMLLRPPSRGRHFPKGNPMMTGSPAHARAIFQPVRAPNPAADYVLAKKSKNEPNHL
jgi:hypothetical protein